MYMCLYILIYTQKWTISSRHYHVTHGPLVHSALCSTSDYSTIFFFPQRLFDVPSALNIYIFILYIQYIYTINAEKAMAPHSSTLAWNIPGIEEPGEL